MPPVEFGRPRITSRTTTDRLRRSNLSTILTMLHRDGPLSRAELTRRTGLNRSTVGVCVADLVGLGLVEESVPVASRRAGRPSPVAEVARGVVAVAVNPEVDAIHIGVVGLGGKVLRRIRLENPTAPTAGDVVSRAADAIAGLTSAGGGERVVGIGLAVPGQVRISDGQVREATHMGWVEEPMARMLEQATGLPTRAANGAILGMRAENVFGAGRDETDLVYFIGGASGVGGGAVTGGHWVTGAGGYAGEFGHTFVRTGGVRCHCGATGCLEAEVTQRRLLEAVGLRSGEEERLPDALADSRDPRVRELVAESIDLLGVAVRTVVNAFNPNIVVLGGFLDALYRAWARDVGDDRGADLAGAAVRSAREGVRVVSAALGQDQLMIGAAELVFEHLLSDPSSSLAAA